MSFDELKKMCDRNKPKYPAFNMNLPEVSVIRFMPDEPTDEEKVLKILKGGFEKEFGMTYEKFKEIYETILEENPEKLI